MYFKALHLSKVKCFRDTYVINITDRKDNPAQWTVIIGNNNTGKTTLLKAIAGLEPKKLVTNISPDANLTDDLKDQLKLLYIPSGFLYRSTIFGEEDILGDEEKGVITAEYNLTIESTETKGAYDYSNGRAGATKDAEIVNLIIYCYGTSRRTSSTNLSEGVTSSALDNLVNDKTELLNTEEWLLQTDYAIKNGSENAKKVFKNIEEIFLKSHILPDIRSIRFKTTEQLKSFVEVETVYGWVRLSALGYGYQITIAWLADLAKRMFDRYPDLDNPLHGPAIVLVDEIDLHLHPEWQRKIIKYLSDLFPNTQFIVTAHSPLIVQSAENVNLIMLEKDDETGSINIRQQFGSFQGWTVEEILRELMDMGDKTRSDRFLKLLGDFEQGLDQGNYDKAKTAYDGLDKILHPASSQRKLLSIQLSSLVPA